MHLPLDKCHSQCYNKQGGQPYESKDNFLHLVDEMVEYQLAND